MSINYNSRIVTDGLVLYLDAANPKSYPGSGTSWYDLSGNGYVGTFVNGVSPFKKNAIIFDGSGDFITLDGFNLNNYLNLNFCIESWVYLNSQSSQMFFNTLPHNSFAISLNREGSGKTSLYIGNGSTWQTSDFRSTNALVLNQWNHIAVTKNNNSISIWHNGINQGSTSAFMPTGFNTAAYIGTYNGSTGENLNGKIYGYRIVIGSPVYTENFTPPIRVENISGIQLLIAQNGGFINNSQSAITVTPSGNTYIESDDAMKFDGTNDYVSFGGVAPNISSSITMLTWIYRISGNGMVISNSTQYGLFSSGSCWYWSVTTNAWVSYASTVTTSTNSWCQLGVTYTPGSSTAPIFYINSIANTVGATTMPFNAGGSGDLKIGEYSVHNPYAPFNGKIGSSMIYNRALSATEIQQNFAATRGRYNI